MQLTQWPRSSRNLSRGHVVLWITLVCLGAAALPTATMAEDISMLPQALLAKVEDARAACSTIENGEFAIEWGAVSRVDLDGDLRADWVLDEAHFACSTAASLFCGTGGCVSHFLVGDQLGSLLNQGWEMADFGPNRVLLADVHGARCDGIGPTPCVTASVWDAEGDVWRSTAAEWE